MISMKLRKSKRKKRKNTAILAADGENKRCGTPHTAGVDIDREVQVICSGGLGLLRGRESCQQGARVVGLAGPQPALQTGSARVI